MSLVTELERLADALAAGDGSSPASPISLTSVAERIARNQGVKSDEVAILGLSLRWRHLYLPVNESLKNVGHIPLTTNSALAARTARESRPEINNNFASVRHASVLEDVNTSTATAA